MPRHEKLPGSAERFQRVRVRLGLTITEMAKRLGVPVGRYDPWEKRGSVPSMAMLMAYKRLGVWGWRDLVFWLAGDPDIAAPAWLEDKNLDPFTPPSDDAPPPPGGLPENVIPFPIAVLQGVANAYAALNADRKTGQIQSLNGVHALSELDRVRRFCENNFLTVTFKTREDLDKDSDKIAELIRAHYLAAG